MFQIAVFIMAEYIHKARPGMMDVNSLVGALMPNMACTHVLHSKFSGPGSLD